MNVKVQLICVYRQQEISTKLFCEELNRFIDSVFHQGDKMIVVGDFNVWVDDANDNDTKVLLKMMNAY